MGNSFSIFLFVCECFCVRALVPVTGRNRSVSQAVPSVHHVTGPTKPQSPASCSNLGPTYTAERESERANAVQFTRYTCHFLQNNIQKNTKDKIWMQQHEKQSITGRHSGLKNIVTEHSGKGTEHMRIAVQIFVFTVMICDACCNSSL
jgi:hypothetical protein